ncbi:MAG: ATP-binding protein [Tannerellaceae bacterium]|nr:ATP-binding protein [Tannerellaceae bacterium]
MELLQDIVTEEKLPGKLLSSQFKFRENEETPQILGIEFVYKEKPYYYALQITGNRIEIEELYESGLGKHTDSLIFERKTDSENITSISFAKGFEEIEENKVLKNVIEKNLAKPNKPIIKLLTTLDNPSFEIIKAPLNWFENVLTILMPGSRPTTLIHRLEIDAEFQEYAEKTITSFHVGIHKLIAEKTTLKDFFGDAEDEKLNELVEKMKEESDRMIALGSRNGVELILVCENDEVFIKSLKISHKGKGGKEADFDLDEESDGTRRLLDFIPAFKDIFSKEKVYVIDEIERSLHPVLIKMIIRIMSYYKFWI